MTASGAEEAHTLEISPRLTAMKSKIAVALVALTFTGGAVAPSAEAHKGKSSHCHTKSCEKRVRIAKLGYPYCNTWSCVKRVQRKVRKREWRYYKNHRNMIPFCTWYGESGVPRRGYGPGNQQFANWRYRIRNGGTFGPPIEGVAYGKYQMMPSTYRSVAKYHDWSKVDQEIAAHRLYWTQGTGPWEAC